jgi:hypothetical protein
LPYKPTEKIPQTLAAQSEITSLSGLDLQLQFVCDQGNKFAIGGLALHVGHGVAEVFLQGFQAVYRIVYSYKMLLFSGFLI